MSLRTRYAGKSDSRTKRGRLNYGLTVAALLVAAAATITAVTPRDVNVSTAAARVAEPSTAELSEFENSLITCVAQDAECMLAPLNAALDACKSEDCAQAAIEKFNAESAAAIAHLEEQLPLIEREVRQSEEWRRATEAFATCASDAGLPDATSGDPAAVRRALQTDLERSLRSSEITTPRPPGFEDASTETPTGVPDLDPLPESVSRPDRDAIEAVDAQHAEDERLVHECQRSSGLIEIEQEMLAQALKGETR